MPKNIKLTALNGNLSSLFLGQAVAELKYALYFESNSGSLPRQNFNNFSSNSLILLSCEKTAAFYGTRLSQIGLNKKQSLFKPAFDWSILTLYRSHLQFETQTRWFTKKLLHKNKKLLYARPSRLTPLKFYKNALLRCYIKSLRRLTSENSVRNLLLYEMTFARPYINILGNNTHNCVLTPFVYSELSHVKVSSFTGRLSTINLAYPYTFFNLSWGALLNENHAFSSSLKFKVNAIKEYVFTVSNFGALHDDAFANLHGFVSSSTYKTLDRRMSQDLIRVSFVNKAHSSVDFTLYLILMVLLEVFCFYEFIKYICILQFKYNKTSYKVSPNLKLGNRGCAQILDLDEDDYGEITVSRRWYARTSALNFYLNYFDIWRIKFVLNFFAFFLAPNFSGIRHQMTTKTASYLREQAFFLLTNTSESQFSVFKYSILVDALPPYLKKINFFFYNNTFRPIFLFLLLSFFLFYSTKFIALPVQHTNLLLSKFNAICCSRISFVLTINKYFFVHFNNFLKKIVKIFNIWLLFSSVRTFTLTALFYLTSIRFLVFPGQVNLRFVVFFSASLIFLIGVVFSLLFFKNFIVLSAALVLFFIIFLLHGEFRFTQIKTSQMLLFLSRFFLSEKRLYFFLYCNSLGFLVKRWLIVIILCAFTHFSKFFLKIFTLTLKITHYSLGLTYITHFSGLNLSSFVTIFRSRTLHPFSAFPYFLTNLMRLIGFLGGYRFIAYSLGATFKSPLEFFWLTQDFLFCVYGQFGWWFRWNFSAMSGLRATAILFVASHRAVVRDFERLNLIKNLNSFIGVPLLGLRLFRTSLKSSALVLLFLSVCFKRFLLTYEVYLRVLLFIQTKNFSISRVAYLLKTNAHSETIFQDLPINSTYNPSRVYLKIFPVKGSRSLFLFNSLTALFILTARVFWLLLVLLCFYVLLSVFFV